MCWNSSEASIKSKLIHGSCSPILSRCEILRRSCKSRLSRLRWGGMNSKGGPGVGSTAHPLFVVGDDNAQQLTDGQTSAPLKDKWPEGSKFNIDVIAQIGDPTRRGRRVQSTQSDFCCQLDYAEAIPDFSGRFPPHLPRAPPPPSREKCICIFQLFHSPTALSQSVTQLIQLYEIIMGATAGVLVFGIFLFRCTYVWYGTYICMSILRTHSGNMYLCIILSG